MPALTHTPMGRFADSEPGEAWSGPSQDQGLMESLASLLEGTGGFKVLRRLDVRLTPLPDRLDGRLALFVDVATTGVDPSFDRIAGLAVVPFQYDRDGRILAVHVPLDGLRDAAAEPDGRGTSLTGIHDGVVRGKSVDVDALNRLLAQAALVVAHNALFDRSFIERAVPAFADVPWACSMSDVPWRAEGVTSLKLELLAARAGFFFRAHRAADDCLAGIELLRRPLPRSGRLAMAELLRSARRETMRITATTVPFALGGLLRRRGYRWRPRSAGGGMAWMREVSAEAVDAEIRFLRSEVYGRAIDPPVARVSAYDRYSTRV